MKKLIAAALTLVLLIACVFTLVACSETELVIWVGEESATYYAGVMEQYVADYAEKNGKEFPYKVVVKGVDASTAAEAILKDAQAGPAIFTIPHDNLGKLIGTNPVIAALTSQSLLAQIEADNPDGYKKVVKNTIGGTEYTFAAPYIGQSLVLFYDKSKITDTEVETWEGIMAAAKRAGSDVKATTVMGNDSYNLSFLMLARNAETNKTSVKIYEGSTLSEMLENSYCTGDDTMASFKWGQRFFNDPNGGALSGSTTFDALMKDGKVLSLIGGAWKYDSVKAALGDNLGIAQLPTYTITAEDAYGTCEEGTVMKSGTFADCKVLCINGMNEIVTGGNKQLCEDIVEYLTSKEIQEGSFEECNNLPAYKNAAAEFEAMQADTNEALLAKKQVEMAEWGIPQPFGYDSFLNLYFYQKGADTYTQDILLMRDSANNNATAYDTDEKLLDGLTIIQNIWKTGKASGN